MWVGYLKANLIPFALRQGADLLGSANLQTQTLRLCGNADERLV